ncbi:MAG: type II toxin-antitoxin system HipA family toxin [Alphaproteobacteria bacterium]|nr:type II toxin-antitoxin system HipA family toxin [Alphaproteobacteria bacterium]
MKLNVYLNTYGSRKFVGVLEDIGAKIYFQYAPEFIKEGIEISPFKLPLQERVFEGDNSIFGGLFGVFNDSLPDGWGCLLLDRKLQKQGLSFNSIRPLHRLSMVGNNPMGALEYEPSEDIDDMPDVNLDFLAQDAKKILLDKSNNGLDELLKLNGSSGGARPKIVALVSNDKKTILSPSKDFPDNFSHWLIKFSNTQDDKNLGVQEYVYSLIAKDAGIEMPETYLFPSQISSGYFGVKRFDRVGNQKVHTHTACGLLNADFRVSSMDYTNLLKLTFVLTKDIKEVEKMVRLMIFNVKAGNKDDHTKNFSYLIDRNNNWKLAPAYDLTPSFGINGEQTTMVNGKGKDITNDDFITVASEFDIDKQKVCEMIEAVDNSLSNYEKLMKQYK